MKASILIMSLLFSATTFASVCSTEQGVRALCESDARKMEKLKSGSIRTETYRSKVIFSGGGIYPTPIECRFSYIADQEFEGSYAVVKMIGVVRYAPVSCQKLSMSSTTVE